MKIEIGNKNPYGYSRYGFLWEILLLNSSKKRLTHMDYGAFDGRILSTLSTTGVIFEGYGLDANKKIIDSARPSLPKNVELSHLELGNRQKKKQLPYQENFFDSVSILDVLEHISDQKAILREFHRILKEKGVLVITVPKKHVFSVLDLGNFKFYFPQIHRKFYEIKFSKKAYYIRYIECSDGMFGDIEKKKMWHQHFSPGELRSVLEAAGFRVLVTDGSGLFVRVLSLFKYFLPGSGMILNWLIKIDAKFFSQANLFCVAEKTSGSKS